MKAMFVNSKEVPYASLIVAGDKVFETRSRNMLSALVGERVAVVETGRGVPMVVGYVNVVSASHYNHFTACDAYEFTYVPGHSKYASNQWFYRLSEPKRCSPYPLPSSAVRHGRSWCEF